MIDIKFKNEIISERIILKRPTLDFKTANMLFSYIEKNREHLEKWLPWVPNNTPETDSFSFLQSVQKGFETNTKGEYFIIEKSTGDFCGIIGIHVHNTPTKSEIALGYWQDKDKCGNGYITEAVQRAETEIFSQNIMRIIIENDTENIASVNIPKKLGYHLDGVLRSSFYSTYFKNYRDKNVWSKLNPSCHHR